MRATFWFVPASIVAASIGLAWTAIWLDTRTSHELAASWPMLFGAGAAGSRGLLSAIATSMITVAGVVFSITIVALSLSSSQYTSRVLRNFMRDRVNQAVLGVFVGIFAYCLVVLRTIRAGDEGAFVPTIAVMVGLFLALVGIALLIYFIHHIAVSIQAASIIAAAASETIVAVDDLFPSGLGSPGATDDEVATLDAPAAPWIDVPSASSGYIESIAGDRLMDLARRRDLVVRMARAVGEFVVEGTPLAFVFGVSRLDDELATELRGTCTISRHRTVEQDVGFGIRQLVDIALKALSPGINDSTTAVMCVDYLTAIVSRLATRTFPPIQRVDDNRLRVIVRAATFDELLCEAFDQIRQNADGNPAVLLRLVAGLETIASQTTHPRRRRALRTQLSATVAVIERSIIPALDRAPVELAAMRVFAILDGTPPP